MRHPVSLTPPDLLPEVDHAVVEWVSHAHTCLRSKALPYRWRQTLNDVTVSIPVPPGTKARDLVVEIKKTTIKAGLKGKEPILSGTLPKEIKVDDCTWTLGAKSLPA